MTTPLSRRHNRRAAGGGDAGEATGSAWSDGLLSQEVASGGVPISVVSSTIKAASLFAAVQAAATGVISANVAALTEGVLKAMVLTKLKIAIEMLVAVAILGVGVGSLRQQVLAQQPADKTAEAKPEQETVLNAEGVTAVDAAKSTITLVIKGEGEKTFTVAKDAKVEIDGKPGKLADVPVGGASVTLKLSADQTTAFSIQASGPSAGGEVAAADAAKNTLTLAINAEEKTCTVTKDAKVEIDGKPGNLADVAVGYSVILHLTVDGKAVWSIQATGPLSGGDVKAVDAAKNTLTVTNQLGEQTFDVAKDINIVIDGKSGKFAHLKEGMEVGLRLSVDKKTVVSITAKDKG